MSLKGFGHRLGQVSKLYVWEHGRLACVPRHHNFSSGWSYDQCRL